jgi:hypothetical protein
MKGKSNKYQLIILLRISLIFVMLLMLHATVYLSSSIYLHLIYLFYLSIFILSIYLHLSIFIYLSSSIYLHLSIFIYLFYLLDQSVSLYGIIFNQLVLFYSIVFGPISTALWYHFWVNQYYFTVLFLV